MFRPRPATSGDDWCRLPSPAASGNRGARFATAMRHVAIVQIHNSHDRRSCARECRQHVPRHGDNRQCERNPARSRIRGSALDDAGSIEPLPAKRLLDAGGKYAGTQFAPVWHLEESPVRGCMAEAMVVTAGRECEIVLPCVGHYFVTLTSNVIHCPGGGIGHFDAAYAESGDDPTGSGASRTLARG